MAEAERRPGKMPLLKQPEIEEVEEENGRVHDEESSSSVEFDVSSSERSNSLANSSEQERPTQPLNGLINGPTSPPPMLSQQSVETPAQAASPNSGGRPKQITSGASLSKQKPLLRGTAVCEGASPPPQPVPEVKVFTTPDPDVDDIPSVLTTPILGQPRDGTARSPLQKNGSQSSDAGTTSSLSRESSIEKSLYKDSTGVDLEEFIKKTLHKSPKDRKMLLQIEKDFKQFVDNQNDRFLQLAEMSSYDRMLVHRMAAFYGMDHNISQTGKSVIVSKTKYTRVPEFNCDDYVKSGVGPDMQSSETKRRIILKPKHHSFDEPRTKMQMGPRTKSLEERQKTYDEKRKLIFGSASQDETGANFSLDSTLNKPKLSSRDQQWSSTDSSGYGTEDSARRGGRGIMTKSNSYGGKPTIHLTPSNTRTCSLSKADSIQSGNYESAPVAVRPNKLPTQSPENSQSPLSRCSSTDAGHSPSLGFGAGICGPPYPVLVATDITTIPPGSMVVNPHTLQPHMNPDGTVYRYDPNGPPPPFLAQIPSAPTSVCQTAPSGNVSFGPSVQYQDPNDVCNLFSRMTVDGSMDGGGQMVTLPHHPHSHLQQPQPAHQGQPHNPHPLMVTTSLGQHVAQSPQPFPSSYASFTAMPTPYYSNPQVMQGPPVRYVITTGHHGHTTPVDSQGQPVHYMGSAPNSVPSGVYTTHPHHQTFSFVPTGTSMQPGLGDQMNMAPGAMYGQTVFTGESGGNGTPYSIPYGPVTGVYTYTTYTPPGNGGNGGQVGGATFYAPPQSSSPQLSFVGFGSGPTGQASIRPATPPSQMHHGLNMTIGQPVGAYQQAGGGAMGMGHPPHHRVSSPPQYNPYMGTVYTPAPHFPGQVRPVGQVQVPMVVGGGGDRSGTNAGSVSTPSHYPHHHHQSHHNTPPLQHSQSFSIRRSNPGGGASPANHLNLSGAANGNPTPPQASQHHTPVVMKSMSMSCIRPMGGAATSDKENTGMVGGAAFVTGINKAFATQLAAQPDLRMMGAAVIRPQLSTLPLAFTQQPGQPIKNRGSGPRPQRGSKRSNPRSGSTGRDADARQ